jgi:hypothetical protein
LEKSPAGVAPAFRRSGTKQSQQRAKIGRVDIDVSDAECNVPKAEE